MNKQLIYALLVMLILLDYEAVIVVILTIYAALLVATYVPGTYNAVCCQHKP